MLLFRHCLQGISDFREGFEQLSPNSATAAVLFKGDRDLSLSSPSDSGSTTLVAGGRTICGGSFVKGLSLTAAIRNGICCASSRFRCSARDFAAPSSAYMHFHLIELLRKFPRAPRFVYILVLVHLLFVSCCLHQFQIGLKLLQVTCFLSFGLFQSSCDPNFASLLPMSCRSFSTFVK